MSTIDNNHNTRNELSQIKADILREKGKEKRKRKSDSVLSTIDKTNHNHNTQKEIALMLILREKGKENMRLSEGRGIKGLSTIEKPLNNHNTQKHKLGSTVILKSINCLFFCNQKITNECK